MTHSKHRFLETADAVDLLVEFGDAYSLASQVSSEHDPAGLLAEVTQLLLAMLTNKAATPDEVQAVLPYDAVLVDA